MAEVIETMGEIIEIQYRYDGHLVVFFYNTHNINGFKESIDYKSFVEIFGCTLSINEKILPKGVVISNNTIYLSVCERDEFKKENFEIGILRIMNLFDIDKKIKEEIIENVMKSIPKSNKKTMYHNILIINDGLRQKIQFDYLILSKCEHKEYSYLHSRNI
jgi:hypothetical protein